jgi:hypothetical protein
MGRVSPRRLIVAAVTLSACSAKHQAPPLAVPQVEPGRLSVRAVAADPLGSVQPVAIAMTNGLTESVRIDSGQVFAVRTTGERVAPLPPNEAARIAEGRAPGALGSAGKGAVTGGVGGAISGAISGGIGSAVGIGTAVGVVFGAITGALSGGASSDSPGDVRGFTERSLPDGSVAPGLSATGYVYYPEGSYQTLELQPTDDPSGGLMPERVPIESEE